MYMYMQNQSSNVETSQGSNLNKPGKFSIMFKSLAVSVEK